MGLMASHEVITHSEWTSEMLLVCKPNALGLQALWEIGIVTLKPPLARGGVLHDMIWPKSHTFKYLKERCTPKDFPNTIPCYRWRK